MACLGVAGCEIGFVGGSLYASADWHGNNGSSLNATRDTSVKRSGLASWKFDSTGSGGACHIELDTPNGISTNTTFYWRIYFRPVSLPTSTVRIMEYGFNGLTSLEGIAVRLTSAGKIQLYNNADATQIGSDSSATITANSGWYRLELKLTIGATQPEVTSAELLLDGTSVAVDNAITTITNSGPNKWAFGWLDNPGTSKVINFDDHMINDNVGADNNSWPGAGRAVVMVPTADVQRGSWTGGAGGTTNLFDALNNLPPVGVAPPGNNTSQVRNGDNSGDNATDEMRMNLGSYTTAGVGASETVRAIQWFVSSGEEVATGSKTLTATLTNPTATLGTGFDVGSSVVGTWPTDWGWRTSGTFLQNPSITKGTDVTFFLRKVDGTTRFATVCSLGLYLAVEEAVAAAPGPVLRRQPAHRFLRMR